MHKKINVENSGENNKTYANESLAQIGDSIIKLVVSIDGYNEKLNKS